MSTDCPLSPVSFKLPFMLISNDFGAVCACVSFLDSLFSFIASQAPLIPFSFIPLIITPALSFAFLMASTAFLP